MFKKEGITMKIIAIILASIIPLTIVQAMEKKPQDIQSLLGRKAAAPTPKKLTKQDISKKIAAITQNINAIKESKQSPNQLMINRAKMDLGIVSRGLDSIRKETLTALAKKPIGGFNAQKSFTDIQNKLNQTYRKLQAMSAQERAQALGQLSTLLTQFQDKVKRAVPSALLIRLSELQSKLYILAEKTRKMPTDEKAAFAQMVKDKVGQIKTHVDTLKTLGLQKEAQELKAAIQAFKKSNETKIEQLQKGAAAIYEK
ncbi:MAG: hypothetical protein NTY95_17560, partial [Bacteroidia bacterium]|nr:hypothetical protein [Bacteroidia bacterium]